MKTKLKWLTLAVAVCAIGLRAARADVVAYWKLDDSAGTVAKVGFGESDGVLKGSPQWVSGRFGGALEFDGIDDYVNCGGGKGKGDPNTWADISGAITVAAWIKVNDFTRDWQAIVTKGDSAWRLARDGKKNSVEFSANMLDKLWVVRGKTNVNDAKWHHVVGVYDGSRAYLYVDSVPDGEVRAPKRIYGNRYDVYIGENAEQKGRQWNGLIDEVIVFNHALKGDELRQLYSLGGESFVSEGLQILSKAAREAEKAFNEQNPRTTISITEKKIAEGEEWIKKNPNEAGSPHRIILSRLYFMLAKSKEAAARPAQEIVETYKESLLQSLRTPDCVPAMLWLYNGMSEQDYANLIRQSIAKSEGLGEYVHRIAAGFEANGQWRPFEVFLDATFAGDADVTALAEAVIKGLKNGGSWASSFSRYCNSNPRLTPYIAQLRARRAEEYIAGNKFQEAAEVYREILKLYGPEQDSSLYKFKLCECMFYAGKYADVIGELDDFMAKYKRSNRALTRQAMTLKGRAHVQLSEIEQATDTFLTLVVDFPEAKQAPEANFFIGYCDMLRGRHKEAKQAFEMVIRDYPDSSYASRAILCLRRIEKLLN
jgi:tetratricopeptide (TPR) repeat protein